MAEIEIELTDDELATLQRGADAAGTELNEYITSIVEQELDRLPPA